MAELGDYTPNRIDDLCYEIFIDKFSAKDRLISNSQIINYVNALDGTNSNLAIHIDKIKSIASNAESVNDISDDDAQIILINIFNLLRILSYKSL